MLYIVENEVRNVQQSWKAASLMHVELEPRATDSARHSY